MPGLLRPDDLKQIYSNAEKARMDEARLYDKRKQEQDSKLREEFMSREIHQEAIDRINSAISRAANSRLHRVRLLRSHAATATIAAEQLILQTRIGRTAWKASPRGRTIFS